MNREDSMDILTAVTAGMLVLAIWLLLGAFYVSAYEINPGESLVVDCRNCSVGTDIFINDIFPVDCIAGVNFTQTETNATCKIHKDLQGGQFINNTGGSCDINITCDSSTCGRFQDVDYPTTISFRKTNGSSDVLVDILVKNFKDEQIQTWTESFEPEKTVDATYKFDFICPHEIITDVNMQTCSKYLDPILGEQNPLIYALATGQNNCTNTVTRLQGEITGLHAQEVLLTLEKQQLNDKLGDCLVENQDLKFDLTDPKGDCSKDKEQIFSEKSGQANFNLGIAILFAVGFVVMVFRELTSGPEGL